ncbi:MAG: hypothetical protein NZ696_00675 [Thermomicrobium sp.]|nr:hypothetical protein [Thermomicrobium sp.]
MIDTLGLAFTLLNRRPYLVLMLVTLDAVLWLGPRVSSAELLRVLRNTLAAAGTPTTAPSMSWPAVTGDFDLALLATWFIPSLVAALGPQSFAMPYAPIVWHLGFVPTLVAAGSLLIIGIVVAMGYWTVLAFVVRGEKMRGQVLLRAILRNSMMMVAYLGVLCLGLVGLAVILTPLLAASMLVGLGDAAFALLSLLLALAGLVFFVGAFFVEDAIVLSNAGPFRAFLYSAGIVRVALWPSLRFIAALSMIQVGLPLALRVFAGNPLAVPFALISYAYVATGLVLASLLFYRDRIALVLRRNSVRVGRVSVEDER